MCRFYPIKSCKGLVFSLLFMFLSLVGSAQVGINTTTPQEKLHIAGATAKLRISSLDSINNGANGSADTAPLFVNDQGEFSLVPSIYIGGDGTLDHFDGSLPAFSITEATSGWIDQVMHTETITVTRDSYIEVKYTLSFEVYLDAAHSQIVDGIARNVQTYILLNGDTSRKFAITARCHMNSDVDGQSMTYYNSAAAYIFLTAGTHNLDFYAGVGSNTATDATHVEFAKGQDLLLIRIL